jgi:hypothetical protein
MLFYPIIRIDAQTLPDEIFYTQVSIRKENLVKLSRRFDPKVGQIRLTWCYKQRRVTFSSFNKQRNTTRTPWLRNRQKTAVIFLK